ncbi:DMT family transporter [Phaeobacter gallaeciensis]|jgi:drug/metabolite transporter (DMT)-like permease|uniref:DMT family transporter n=2 Tax=Phaeobacter gallaeciensis TaxID=60890 RepID=A0ABD4XDS4_9RHOB|nr:DMT family transporter [Phaeobacter gallaeciensis]MDE4142237.1 DMT family transporter [Phaeobacter gallaeciensis]MDE4146567.1 DMT family transporter [Phaeobacter gallaeciensis]MDE4150640.1 DMT family transporter [Phaeobacter gallaeciensis]MDE4154819.1 DMT family transporter [Phaeobacter gallaeciensis]MDE4159291.1 DMT family transporter [Phaeobacter gallaeciensis]
MRLAAPVLFVFLWSTGFIGAKYGLPHAEPMTFAALRFGIVTALVTFWALVSRAAWPRPRLAFHAGLIGVLMHAGFMGTTFVAISFGVEAGTAALIAALQPILSTLLARPLLGEKTRPRQWLGLCLGLLGVLLVVGNKLTAGLGAASGYGLCLLALASLSSGTIWQKKFGSTIPAASGYVIQFGAATMVTLSLALAFETMQIDWSLDFALALTWLVLAISIGAIVLLYGMLRTGDASRVSSLFFLTPVSTALIGWIMFGEQLSVLALVGVALAAAGVFIAARR